MREIMRPVVNYLYFIALFFWLLLVHSFHIFISHAAFLTQMSFLIDGILQCALETMVLFFLAQIVCRFSSKTVLFMYICFTSFLLAFQTIPLSLLTPVLVGSGIILFLICEKWEKKTFSLRKTVMGMLVLVALHTFWDLCAIFPLAPTTYDVLKETLPLKTCLLSPHTSVISDPKLIVQEKENRSSSCQ